MISGKTIKSRMQISDAFTAEETRRIFDILTEQELSEIPEDEDGREHIAFNRALLRLRRGAWVSGCMAAMGAGGDRDAT